MTMTHPVSTETATPVGPDDGTTMALSRLGGYLVPRVAGVDEDHVRMLAELPAQDLPAVLVHRPTGMVVDGRHRVQAARLRGEHEIRVRFVDGSEGDAFVLALRSNSAHGLPLSRADRRAAARRVLADHPERSDRWVASMAGLSAGTVGRIRREGPDQGAIRLGRDGRVRPASSEEGRRRAAELIGQDPSLSLRAVARIARISPETVRDVRGRLERGEGPLPTSGTAGAKPDGRGGAGGGRPVSGRPDAAPALSVAVRRLKADPAIRSSETGRLLLRLLDAHAQVDRQLGDILAGLPGHCRDAVEGAAAACSTLWADVAGDLSTDLETQAA
jgi:ParB-like chromosome segregation protein Spo0J